MNTQKSQALLERAQKLIPGGVNSPVRAFRGVGGTPRFIARGEGSRIWDADGNEYIDYVGSWGPLLLGHRHLRLGSGEARPPHLASAQPIAGQRQLGQFRFQARQRKASIK